MAGEAWLQTRARKKKERRPLADLAVWCDTNLSPTFARKLGTLVSNNQALKSVVGILKAARTKGEVLNNAQRIALDGQLRGAGPWEAGAGPAPTSGKVAARPARTREALSKDPKYPSRTSYAAAAAGAKDPALRESERLLAAALKNTKRLEEVIKRGEAASAAPGGSAVSAADVEMNNPRATHWLCEFCGRGHPKPKRSCHICHTPRVTTVQAGPAPPHTSEEAEAEYARLSQQLAGLKALGTEDYVAAAIAGAQARLAQLKTQPAAVAVKTARQSYEQAQKATDELESRHSALVKKTGTLVERIDELGLDLEAATKAMDLVGEELAAASLLRDAALAALGTPMADVSVTAATAPSAAAAAAEAINEYKAKVCGLLSSTTLTAVGDAYSKYKESEAMGEAPMEELDFLLNTLLKHVVAQADVQLAAVSAGALRGEHAVGVPILSRTLHGKPTSPVSVEAAATPVPDSADLTTTEAGAAQRGSGDGQRGQRPSIKTASIEVSRAKFEGHRAVVQQRNAARGENLDAKREGDL